MKSAIKAKCLAAMIAVAKIFVPTGIAISAISCEIADNEIEDKLPSLTISLRGGIGMVTIKGDFNKATMAHIAGLIGRNLADTYDNASVEEQSMLKKLFRTKPTIILNTEIPNWQLDASSNTITINSVVVAGVGNAAIELAVKKYENESEEKKDGGNDIDTGPEIKAMPGSVFSQIAHSRSRG